MSRRDSVNPCNLWSCYQFDGCPKECTCSCHAYPLNPGEPACELVEAKVEW